MGLNDFKIIILDVNLPENSATLLSGALSMTLCCILVI
jgi:hypothetical protein